MLNNSDKTAISGLCGTDCLASLRRLAEEIAMRNNLNVSQMTNEFEYLKENLLKDGKILGLNEFFKEIDKITQEHLQKYA